MQSMTPTSRAFHAILFILGLGLSLTCWPNGSEAFPAQSPNSTDNTVARTHPQHAAKEVQTQLPLVLTIVKTPTEAPGTLSRRFPQGCRLLLQTSAGSVGVSLTSDFFTAADPRISFDGSRVIFSGKKTADSLWQIYEMNLDGSGVRQVTQCPTDSLRPAYLAKGNIAFTSLSQAPDKSVSGKTSGQSRNAPSDRKANQTMETSQIWVSKLDGSDAHPITFGPGDFQLETVLKNGAILVTARSPLLPSNGQAWDRELYTIRIDGTALSTLRCDHQHPAIRSQAAEIDDGSVVFVKSSLTNPGASGQLAWIRRGALHNAPLTGPTVQVRAPHSAGGTNLIVARELPTGAQAGTQPAIYAFDASAEKFGVQLFKDSKLAAVEAAPVAAHETPRWYWSTLNPELQRGYFICLNSYLAQDAPGGRIPAKLGRVRVLTLDSATQQESVLGDASIEEDGSFYIAVPPDQPVRFEVLDAGGKVVRAQKSWIWARSGEEHGCVGCHEDRAVAPENRWPMALRRFDTPTRLDLVKK